MAQHFYTALQPKNETEGIVNPFHGFCRHSPGSHRLATLGVKESRMIQRSDLKAEEQGIGRKLCLLGSDSNVGRIVTTDIRGVRTRNDGND